MIRNRIFLYSVSSVLGILLLWWGYGNLFPIEQMENRLVEEYLCNWYSAPIIARVLIALNFVVGVFLILNINPGNWLPKLLLGVFGLSIYDLAWESLSSSQLISPGYSRIFDTNLPASIMICVVIVLVAFALIKYGRATDIKIKWVKYPLGLVIFSAPFILNPVYPSDLMNQSVAIESSFDLESFEGLPVEYQASDKALLTFYSTSCPHCLNAMRRLTISKRQADDYIPIFIGFLGSEEGISAFFKEARAKFDYVILDSENFFNLSGSTYPSFILLENGEATLRWNGRTFNYQTLQQLAE